MRHPMDELIHVYVYIDYCILHMWLIITQTSPHWMNSICIVSQHVTNERNSVCIYTDCMSPLDEFNLTTYSKVSEFYLHLLTTCQKWMNSIYTYTDYMLTLDELNLYLLTTCQQWKNSTSTCWLHWLNEIIFYCAVCILYMTYSDRLLMRLSHYNTDNVPHTLMVPDPCNS